MSPTVTKTQADTLAALQAQIAEFQRRNQELEERNAALTKSSERRLSMKVSSKGGVSVYGLGRFPISLYRSQWEKVIGLVPQLQAFMKEHASELAEKPGIAAK